MSLPIFQRTIVDSSGNIQPGASVAVRNETTGDLVTIYADREGGAGKPNPFLADSEGFATFYVEPGEYQVTATTPAGTITWSHVAIGDTALLQLAQPTGDTLVGSDDGASGSLWTTVAGFLTHLKSTAGAAIAGFSWSALPAAVNKVDWGIQSSANGVNVLRYIPPSEWGAIKSGTSTVDVAPYIQAAWDANKRVYHPAGVYGIGTPLNKPTQRMLTGDGIATEFKALPSLVSATKPVITSGVYSPVLAKVPMISNRTPIQWWGMRGICLNGAGLDVYGLWLAENFYGSISDVFILNTGGRPYTSIRGQAVEHTNFVCYGCGDGVVTYDNTNLKFICGGFERLSGIWYFDQRQPNSFAKGGVSFDDVWFESDLTNFPTEGFLRLSGRRNKANFHAALATTATVEQAVRFNDTTDSRLIDGITMGASPCTGADVTVNNVSGAMFLKANAGARHNRVAGYYTASKADDDGVGNTWDVSPSLAVAVQHVTGRFQVRNGDTGAGLPIGATNWVIDVDHNAGTPIIRMLGNNNNAIDSDGGNLRLSSNLGQRYTTNSGGFIWNAAGTGYVFTGSSGATGWQKPIYYGAFATWVDSTGKLRIKNGAPTSDADGAVVGAQT